MLWHSTRSWLLTHSSFLSLSLSLLFPRHLYCNKNFKTETPIRKFHFKNQQIYYKLQIKTYFISQVGILEVIRYRTFVLWSGSAWTAYFKVVLCLFTQDNGEVGESVSQRNLVLNSLKNVKTLFFAYCVEKCLQRREK